MHYGNKKVKQNTGNLISTIIVKTIISLEIKIKIFFLKLFIVIIRILFAAGDGVTAAINAEFEGDLTCGRAISERWKVAKFLLWLKVNSLKIQTNDRILVQPHYYQTQYRSRITKSK